MVSFGFKTKLYAQQIIGDCMPIYALYALMFAERSGLSTAEISLLFLLWTAIAIFAEVPTGIMADKFSRKSAIFYSYILQAAGFAMWLVWPSFAGYAVGFLLWGIGYAFSSGTFQAYLYEEMRAQGQAKEFNKVYARTVSMQFGGMFAAYVIAAAVGSTSYTAALIISIILSIVAACITLSFPYHSKKQPGEFVPEKYFQLLSNAIKEVRHNRTVLAYVIALAIAMAIVGTVEEYVPLFYSFVGFETAIIPIILAAGLLITTALGWYAHKLERLTFTKVAVMMLAGACLLFVGVFGGKWLALFGMMGFMRLVILTEVLFDSSLQHVIQDERRATVGSLASFGGEVITVLFLAVVGIAASQYGDDSAYKVIAVIAGSLGIVVLIVGRWSNARIEPPQEGDAPIAVPGKPV